MDENLRATYRLKLEKTAKALEKNNMQAFVCENSAEVCSLVSELLREGEQISCGGSMTLAQSGVMDIMRSGKYDFIDRAKASSPEEVGEMYRKVQQGCSYNVWP